MPVGGHAVVEEEVRHAATHKRRALRCSARRQAATIVMDNRNWTAWLGPGFGTVLFATAGLNATVALYSTRLLAILPLLLALCRQRRSTAARFVYVEPLDAGAPELLAPELLLGWPGRCLRISAPRQATRLKGSLERRKRETLPSLAGQVPYPGTQESPGRLSGSSAALKAFQRDSKEIPKRFQRDSKEIPKRRRKTAAGADRTTAGAMTLGHMAAVIRASTMYSKPLASQHSCATRLSLVDATHTSSSSSSAPEGPPCHLSLLVWRQISFSRRRMWRALRVRAALHCGCGLQMWRAPRMWRAHGGLSPSMNIDAAIPSQSTTGAAAPSTGWAAKKGSTSRRQPIIISVCFLPAYHASSATAASATNVPAPSRPISQK